MQDMFESLKKLSESIQELEKTPQEKAFEAFVRDENTMHITPEESTIGQIYAKLERDRALSERKAKIESRIWNSIIVLIALATLIATLAGLLR